MLKFDKRSIARFDSNLRAIEQGLEDSVGRALKQSAGMVISNSLEVVPMYTGSTWSSGYSGEPQRDEDGMTVNVGYASPNTDIRNPESGKMVSEYVYTIHENLEGNIVSGQPKFLEMPVIAYGSKFIEDLRNAVPEALVAGRE